MRSVASVAIVLALAHAAGASPGGPYLGGPTEGSTYLLFGPEAGAVVVGAGGADDISWLAGGEVSVAHLRGDFWFGGYADALVDGRHDGARFSLGVEGGLIVVGADLGLVVDTDARMAVRLRPALTMGLASLALGPVIPIDGRSPWGEVTLMVKLPLEVHHGSSN